MNINITKMSKEKKNEFMFGLSERHVSQIIRRKMLSKVYKDKTKYNKKDNSWKSEI